jgi:hypothetical protein
MKTTILALTAALLLAACSKGPSSSASVVSEAGKKLTLTHPKAVMLVRGGTAKTDLTIARVDTPGDVTIQFTKLPKGVEIVDAGNKILGTSGTYTLKAGDSADLVENYVANVTATAADGYAVTEPIEITVREVAK